MSDIHPSHLGTPALGPAPDPVVVSSVTPAYAEWKKSSVSPVLLTAVAELARIAAVGLNSDELLRELAQLTMLATSVDGVGTMRCSGARVAFVHADCSRTAKIDRLQERLQQGPCRTSVKTREAIAVGDFAAAEAIDQWPDLAAAALAEGLHSALAVPLLARGRVWGVLDIYRAYPHRWTVADLIISKTLAEVAVSLLVLSADRDRAREAARTAVIGDLMTAAGSSPARLNQGGQGGQGGQG